MFFAVWAGGVCVCVVFFFFFCAVWAGDVFFSFWAGKRGGGRVFFCCLGRGRVFFLLFGRGSCFFFAVWAGDGSSLTYLSAWLVLKRPNHKKRPNSKKEKHTGSGLCFRVWNSRACCFFAVWAGACVFFAVWAGPAPPPKQQKKHAPAQTAKKVPPGKPKQQKRPDKQKHAYQHKP